MARAVLFDVFETLVTERGTLQPRASSAGEALGLIAAGFRPQWRRHRQRVLCGQQSFAEALAEIASRLGGHAPPEAVARVRADRVHARSALFRRIAPEVAAMVRDLRAAGLRLAAVSNCMAEDVEGWATCELADAFECASFSFLVGAAKPDPAIYMHALERLGVDAADAWFIGDGADNELAGARQVGLRVAQATWFTRSDVDREGTGEVPRLERPDEAVVLVAAGGPR